MSSRLLSEITYAKRNFDPSNKQDRKLAFKFLKSNSWKNVSENGLCPFICQWPYLNVPSMLKDRLIEYYSEVN